MAKQHGGSGKTQGVLNRGTHTRPNPTHAGSGRPHGITHAPPPPGGTVNRGSIFGMGTLKKRK
jgi:hypothetical protein